MFVLTCVDSDLATGSFRVQGVVPTHFKIHSFRSVLNGNKTEGLIRNKEEGGEEEVGGGGGGGGGGGEEGEVFLYVVVWWCIDGSSSTSRRESADFN
jgi:hypothetical protein